MSDVMTDRAIIKAILEGAGLRPMRAATGITADTYILHYRKNKEGGRFILNLYSPPTVELRNAIRESPIHNDIMVKCEDIVLFGA